MPALGSLLLRDDQRVGLQGVAARVGDAERGAGLAGVGKQLRGLLDVALVLLDGVGVVELAGGGAGNVYSSS
jgi:hypothetical protein